MAHTFDVRFMNPAAAGTLRIDAAGISLAVRRSFFTLLPRTCRIAAAQLRQVYREGEALHLIFTFGTRRRERMLSCRAADVRTAAEIVGLLPTCRTVEVDHPRESLRKTPVRNHQCVLASLLVLAGGAAAALLLIPQRLAERPAAPLPQAPHIPLDINLAPPQLVLPLDYVVTIPRESAWFDVANRHLTGFEKEAAALLAEYRVDRTLLESGAMDVEAFTHRLANLEFRWWSVTYRILEDEAFADLVLLDLRATLLASARHWRTFLAAHADGMRRGDHVMIARSFDDLARAEELLSRARLYLQ